MTDSRMYLDAITEDLVELIMTVHWDLAACVCWICERGRSLGYRPREKYLAMSQDILARGTLVDVESTDDEKGEPPPMDGVQRIALERQRQIEEEGWTPEHDLEHTDAELARAAIAYALPPNDERSPSLIDHFLPEGWKFNPQGRIRDLERAGALIAAEIDRLLTLEGYIERRSVVPADR